MGRTIRRSFLVVLAAVVCAGACAAVRAGFSDLLDKVKDRVGPALLANDVLAEPGAEVMLEASLRSGLRLTGEEGRRIQFHLDERRLGEVRSDRDGNASVRWTAPETPGDYVVRVRVKPDDQPDKPVEDTQLLVAVRKADAPMVVVDLDKTVVASGFHTVLLGNPTPMARSPEVLNRLARTHTIVFLTHRPDYFGPKSKAWLKANGYPPGPVLMSTVGSFLKGSGTYKSEMIAALKKRFTKVEIGIGDKTSDVEAYHENGLKAFLIIQIPDDAAPETLEALADSIKDLPDAVQVVTGWDQVEEGLFGRGKYPRSAMEKKLRSLAAQRKNQEAAKPE